jgi:5-enolpyruvylshikimate-3-phosphate synthase
VEIKVVGPLESKGYVRMTLQMQREFGIEVGSDDELTRFNIDPQTYHPTKAQVEGD